MEPKVAIEDFLQHMILEQGLSVNSVAAYRNDLNDLAKHLPTHSIAETKPSHVNKYFNSLATLGRKPATLARKLSAAKRFFSYFVGLGVLKQNPTTGYRAPRIARYHPDYLSVEEIERIIAAADLDPNLATRDRAVIEMLYGCGLRISELLDLKIGSFEMEAGFIRVVGKGNKQRLVPIGKYAIEAVKTYIDSPERARLPGDSSKHMLVNRVGKRLSRVGLWKTVRKLVIRAGVTKTVTPHTFRHSFATHMLAGGADLRTVQEMLGHADISTTEIYTQIDQGYIVAEHRRHHPRELAGFRRR
jgi:integrase/recombinase XerD